MRDSIIAILALVRSIDVACLTDHRVFGQEALVVIDALISDGLVKRSGNTLELAR